MTENVIHLHKVNKSFGSHHVLKDLDLSVPKRSVFAFLGNNGEGKSTTIRLLIGLLRPDSGDIVIMGKRLKEQSIQIKKQLGCIVDSPALYPQLTASEFLTIGCKLKHLAKSEIDRVLALVDLQNAKNRQVAHFSLGMKQRLALAHALLGEPNLLILDEPTNGLDPHGMLEIRNLIRSLPDKLNCTVFVSSHMLDEVEKIASDVALLKNGQIQCQATLQDILAKQQGQLTLDVSDLHQAQKLLQDSGHLASVDQDCRLIVNSICKERVHHINKLIVESDMRLYQATYQQPSLEEWFLKSTQYA